MGGLLPERLSTSSADEDTKGKRMKRSLSILEWLQAYSIYVAVMSSKFPNRIPDLMGYQSLIIEAHLECKNDCWIGYDRRFRQQAASQPDRPWAAVEPTLWNLAFAGQAKSSRCKHCFSLSHQSAECELSPELLPKTYQNTQRRLICFRWNETTGPSCPYPNCKFLHICYICARNPAITNVSHKAIHCPQQGSQQPIRPLLPPQSTPMTSAATRI